MKNCLFIFVVCVIVGGVLIGCKKGEVMKGTCGDNLQWELQDSVLTISGSGNMDDECFLEFLDFRKVIIKEGVTSIGDRAFCYCHNLTSVVILNSVTSIGYRAFAYCVNLTSVIIPNSVTSIRYEAFEDVPNIEYHGSAVGAPWRALSVNGYIEENLVYNDHTKIFLRACFRTAKGKIVIPNSVISIGVCAFNRCKSLTSVIIPNSVTSIGNYAFCYCHNLTSVIIPNSVTSIGDLAFAYSVNLTSVIIPNSVTSIGDYAFCGVSNIEYHGSAVGAPWGALSVNGYIEENLVYNDHTKIFLRACFRTAKGKIVIPNSVTSIGESAFRCCYELTSVIIPNSVTSIGNYAFFGCKSLTSITIPNSVTSIGYRAFEDVPNIEYHGSAVGAPWGAISVNGYIEENLVYNDHTKIFLRACFRTAKGKIVIPNSVTSIGENAFSRCVNLTSIVIPNSVTSIGNYAFFGCKSLTSVVIPNSVTSIGVWAFNDVPNIEYHGSADGAPWGARRLNGIDYKNYNRE